MAVCLLAVTGLFVFGRSSLAAQLPSETAASALATGVEALRTGRLAQARTDLEKSIRLQPGRAEAYYQLGLLLGQTGNTAAAAELFRRALERKPDWPEAHYNLGLALIADSNGERNWAGAAAEFQTAVRLLPSYPEARQALSTAFLELGNLTEAITGFESLLRDKPSSVESHFQLAKALVQQGRTADAEQHYRQALQLKPDDPRAAAALATLLLAGTPSPEQSKEAVTALKAALRSNPDDGPAQYALARALKAQGLAAEAAVAFRQADALTKRRQSLVRSTRLSNQGLDAAKRGDEKAALQCLREAAALRPDVAAVHFNLGLVLADSGDLAGAEAQIVQAISLQPSEGHFYLSLGRVAKRAGHGRVAQASLIMASRFESVKPAAEAELSGLSILVPSPPDDPYRFGAPSDTADDHFAFATILATRGDWAGAIGEWMRVLTLRPSYIDARINLSTSYVRLGRLDEGELEFRKSLQVSPESVSARFGLAVVLLERNDKASAVRELQEVVRLQPDYPQAKILLANAIK